MPGYSGIDAKRYERVDEVRLQPEWKKPLSELRGKAIRLRFRFRQGNLYSFQIR